MIRAHTAISTDAMSRLIAVSALTAQTAAPVQKSKAARIASEHAGRPGLPTGASNITTRIHTTTSALSTLPTGPRVSLPTVIGDNAIRTVFARQHHRAMRVQSKVVLQELVRARQTLLQAGRARKPRTPITRVQPQPARLPAQRHHLVHAPKTRAPRNRRPATGILWVALLSPPTQILCPGLAPSVRILGGSLAASRALVVRHSQ